MNHTQSPSQERGNQEHLSTIADRFSTLDLATRLVAAVVPDLSQTESYTPPTRTVDGRTAVNTGAVIMNSYPNQQEMVDRAREAIDGSV